MTKIEWCDETINPLVGCSKVSPGCQNCYAEKMAWRLKCMGNLKYEDVVDHNGWTGKISGDLGQFATLPKKPRKVFVVSMGDLFHENTSDGSIAMVFYAMRDYPQHTYMILTKRPKRMAFFLRRKISPNCIKEISNLWLGVTAENQQTADERIPILLQISAAVRFVSVEPMLEAVDLRHVQTDLVEIDTLTGNHGVYRPLQGRSDNRLDWVICGAETGSGARPMELDWARDLRDQCKVVDVPFFFKSAGKIQTPDDLMIREFPKGV